MHTYKSFNYCQNISMDTDPDVQLLLQLNLFIPLFSTIAIMVFILVLYSLTYQRPLVTGIFKTLLKKLPFRRFF